MVHQEHDDHAEKGAQQRNPLVVVPGMQSYIEATSFVRATHLKLGLQPGDFVMLA